MRVLAIVFFFISLYSGYAQSTVFVDEFDDNLNFWRLRNDRDDQTKIIDGEVIWKRAGVKSEVLAQYLNRLDIDQDFSVEATMRTKAIGSTHGLMWGARDKGNAFYFIIKGQKWRTFRAFEGKIIANTNYKYNVKISPKRNTLKMVKKGSQLFYYINNVKVLTQSFEAIDGKMFGFILWQNASVAIERFEVQGVKLPINEISGLAYLEGEIKLGPEVNSQCDEMNPIITADGEQLYFSRKFHPQNTGGPTDLEDAYFSEKINGEWTPSKNLGKPINNHGPNAVHSVSPDGNTLVTMNLYEPDGTPKGQGLSKSNRMMHGRSLPEQFKIRQYYNKSGFNEFFLSSNEKVLLMAIEREGSFGGRDLYVSFNEGNDIWSQPKNMGNSLNTQGVEMSPFLAPDGVTLYFSSNGHPGYGQNDIFMSRRLDNTWQNWSQPQNIGKPINSVGIDAYYSVPANGAYAYFVSTGEAQKTTDIYKIKLPEKVKPQPVVIIKGVVRNSKTKQQIGTKITYRNLESDEEAGVAHSNPQNGRYEIVLPLDQVYAFFAEKEAFYSVRDNIDLTNIGKYQVIKRDLYLTPMEIGQSAQLHNVLFVRSKAILLPGSYPELNKLYDLMQENQGMRIIISGHTDNTGNAVLNQKLSEERAISVRDYLVKKGTPAERIGVIGYGGEQPIADNSKEITRKLNRRVEFEITGY